MTVVELPSFQRLADRLWDNDERNELIDFIARNPESGDIIPGTSGVRKLRWQRRGMGKRGGARVVYFYHAPSMPLFLLLAYAKAERDDMTAAEKRQVASLVAALKQQYKSKG
jgi:hypothetical protein